MKYFIAILLAILIPSYSNAQGPEDDRHKLKLSKKEEPAFPGGATELNEFFSLNLRYPNAALEHKVSGEVLVRFVISEEGAISNVKIVHGLGYGCDEEAIRVVKKMPSWIPAHIDGTPICVTYNLPVVFELPVESTPNAGH